MQAGGDMGYLMICPAILGIILTIIPTVTLGQGEGRVFVRTKGRRNLSGDSKYA